MAIRRVHLLCFVLVLAVLTVLFSVLQFSLPQLPDPTVNIGTPSCKPSVSANDTRVQELYARVAQLEEELELEYERMRVIDKTAAEDVQTAQKACPACEQQPCAVPQADISVCPLSKRGVKMSSDSYWCDEAYGFGLVSAWKNTEKQVCSSSKLLPPDEAAAGVCYTHTERGRSAPASYCDMKRVILDTSKIQMGLKSGMAGEEGHLTYARGALSSACSKTDRWEHAKPQLVYQDLYASFLGDQNSWDTCTTIIEEPVLAITRYEWAHLLFTMAEITNAYVGLHIFHDLDLSKVRVLLLDSHPPGPYIEFYEALSPGGPVIRYPELAGKVCFKRFMTSVPGYNSFILTYATGSANPCHNSDILHGVRNTILDSMGLLNMKPPTNPSVLLVARRPYKHEGFNKQKIGRVFTNEQEIETAAKAAFHNTAGFRIVDFATMDAKQQVETVMSSNILVGMHGAGLVHSIFLPDDGAVVEMFPSGFGENHRDRNIARFLGRSYFSFEVHAGANDAITIDTKQFTSELEAPIHLARSSFGTSAGRCGIC